MPYIRFHFYRDVFKWYDPRNITSELIRIVTNSKDNHVAIEIDNVIYQSQAFYGVHRKNVLYYKRNPRKTIDLAVDDNTYSKIKILLNKYVGYKYDYLCVFGFISGRKVESIKRLFCSEYANLVFYQLIPNYNELSKTLISPKDFFNRILFYKLGTLKQCNQ